MIIAPLAAIAQKGTTDSTKWRLQRPTGVRVSTDVLALIKSATDDTYRGWEINGDVDIGRYLLALDVGYSGRDLQADNDTYSNEGTYFRLGADINFLPKDQFGNVVFFGARYGRGVFSESMATTVVDPVWGSSEQMYSSSDVSSRWFELVGGLKVKVWKVLWLGYTARYKFGLKAGDTDDMIPHDVPGYGRTDKQTTWGFNYQVMVRFPIGKQKK